MIVLYSGTPGSGKSLDTARTIYNWARRGAPIICNFDIAVHNIKTKKPLNIQTIYNDSLNPDNLVQFSRDYFGDRNPKEDSILLVIDEAQLIFNARDWTAAGRQRWNWFFTTHRHFGFFIILVAQFDAMLDKQVRGLIEYEYRHRKVNNMGWRGLFLSCLLLSPVNLFIKVKIWYPMKQVIGSEFFKCRKKYYALYDTFALLDAPGSK